MKEWYIITAGPSAGKSSILRELSKRGYTIRPEAARIVLDQKISEGVDIEEYRQRPQFNEDIIQTDKQIIENTGDDTPIFFDRAIFDNIAYRQMYGLDVPDEIVDYADQFSVVFMLELLEYTDDEVRTEDAKEAREIHNRLRDVYSEQLGFKIVDIPVDTVEQRADMIERVATRSPPVIH